MERYEGMMNLKKYNLDNFYDSLSKLGLTFTEFQMCQFMQYYELLTEWNRFMNLTAITEFEEVCTKHFVDSLSICKVMDCTKELSIIDVGTGAGFPGIPLKIAFPNLRITLLDSLGKRVHFLQEVIEKLKLEQIDAIHGRAEDFAKPDMLREQFDVCVSRAVANLSTLSEYCIPYVKVGGFFISYKSENIAEEMAAAKNAVTLLGGTLHDQFKFVLPNSDIYRTLFMIKKVKATSKKYPRKAGLPSKEPLL